jgi:hypothetical protein
VPTETYHLASTWKNCGYPGVQVLQARLGTFRRSMQQLELRWKTRLEIEAKEWEHKMQPKAARGTIPAMEISAVEQIEKRDAPGKTTGGSSRKRRRQRAKSTAEKVREARICAAIAQGNLGLDYCRDIKPQKVVTRTLRATPSIPSHGRNQEPRPRAQCDGNEDLKTTMEYMHPDLGRNKAIIDRRNEQKFLM